MEIPFLFWIQFIVYRFSNCFSNTLYQITHMSQVKCIITTSCICFCYWRTNIWLYMSYCCSDLYENSDRTHRVHVVRIRSGLTVMVWLIFALNPHPIRTGPYTYDAYKWALTWQNQQTNLCTQRRLRSALAFTQSDQSICLLCAQCIAKNTSVLRANSEASDHTVRMPILI